MKTSRKIIRFSILLVVILFLLPSCKLRSLISDSEFVQTNNSMNKINGTYLIEQDTNNDSISSYHGYRQNSFSFFDIVKGKDKELLMDKNIENLTISYDGKETIVFSLFDGKENLNFTYKCMFKGNYLEIYFTKKRIWALPLFMNYEYDRLRLGLDENSDLIVHKWHTILATLTIMPFDFFGGKDYSHTLVRLYPQ